MWRLYGMPPVPRMELEWLQEVEACPLPREADSESEEEPNEAAERFDKALAVRRAAVAALVSGMAGRAWLWGSVWALGGMALGAQALGRPRRCGRRGAGGGACDGGQRLGGGAAAQCGRQGALVGGRWSSERWPLGR